MSRRHTAGHSVRITEQTFARLVMAAAADGIDKGIMAEDAIVKALDLRERQLEQQNRRDQWREGNGTSIPKPMQQPRPSDGLTRRS